MPKAKVVVGDMSSQEFDAIRKAVHSILHQLETLSALGSGSTAGAIGTALGAIGAAVAAGVDSATGREIVGVVPKVQKHAEAAPANTKLVTLSTSDKTV